MSLGEYPVTRNAPDEMSPRPRVTASPRPLDRRLGPLDAAAIVVSNVIGGGIFFTPILVAQLTGNARAMLLVWLLGGALAFAGAMAYAELAALRPRAGGEYVYLREALRTARRVPDRLDLVRRRLLGRDCRERRRARRLSRPLRAGGGRRDAASSRAAAVRAARPVARSRSSRSLRRSPR